ncbi:hypothetical protein V1285_005594 [Bradyrhizobium sp. AZCC 1620]
MNYAGTFGASRADQSSIDYLNTGPSTHEGNVGTFTVSDAHLLFSGNYERAGRDLIISDQMHHLVVPNYFQGDKRLSLVSPDGAPLDSTIVDALTGHTQYAQAGGNPAGKVVGHIAKMTGSASIVRNGVTIDVQVGDAVYQSDLLQTGSSSTIGLVLIDGTAFNLSANARLMLNDLTFDATSTSNSSFITLVEGAANFVAGQVAKTGDMKVATPAAVIGIRGTAVKLDISSTDGKVDVSVIDQQDGQVHAVEVFRCVPTGVRDPQTGATCSTGALIGTVTSNGPSMSLTPTTNDVIVQQNNKTPAQIAQESAAYQAAIDTYNVQKQINPNLPQHTENTGGNNANPQQTKYAGVGSTPSAPLSTEPYVQLAGLTTQSESEDTVPSTGLVATSSSSPAVGTTSIIATSTATDSPLPLLQNTLAPTVTASLTVITGTSSSDYITSNSELNGTGLPNTEVHFTIDGSPIASSVVADAQGTWSFKPSGLADGAHTIVASQTDAFGNTGAASLSFTLDTTAPSGGTPSLVAGSDTGSFDTDNITAATAPTFTVVLNPSVVAGDTVQLLLGGSPLAHPVTHVITASDVMAGSVSLTVTSGDLGADGTKQVTAQFSDAAGNSSMGSAQNFTLDTAAPAAPSIASVTDDVSPVTGTLSSGGSTNDTDLTVKVSLSGTNAVAGDSVQLYNGAGTGGQLGASYTLTASDISNGFADVQTGALSSGTTYTITARVTDQAGNQSTASGSFVITETGTAPNAPSIASVTDDVAPVTGTLSSGGSTNDTDLTVKVSLSGTNAVAGDSIQLYNGTGTGGQLGASYTLTASDISNGFADVQTGALSSGTTYTITARVTDQAGNQSTASGSFVISEDTTAPAAPSTPDLAAASDSGSSNTDNITNVTTPTFTGTAEAGATVTLFDGASQIGSATADGSGSYSITSSALSQGPHSITAKATDAAGNTSVASAALSMTIDIPAPAAPSIASVTDDVSPVTGTLSSGGSTNDTDLTVKVSLSGTNAVAGDSIQLYNGAGTGGQLGASYTLTASDISNGFADVQTGALSSGTTYTITARVTDQAGNQSTASGSFVISEDTTAPAAPSTPDLAAASDSGSSNTDNITNVTTPTFTGTAEAGATVTLFDGASQIGSATADGSGSYSITSSALSQGPHSITAKATDAAGNTSVASAALSMTIDIPAPAAPSIASVTDDVSPVTGTLSSGGSTNDTDLTVKVSLSGTNAVAGDSVQLYNGAGTGGQLGASYTLTASDISNGFADVQTGALSSGATYTITARVTDQAGNQSTASGSFVITETGTAPNAPSIASVTDDVSPVTGTLSSGGSTNDTDLTVKVSLSGTNAVAGDSVQLYNGAGTGGQLGASYTLTASDISNGFADVQTGALSSGATYTITARVTDQAGNQSTASGSFVISEDTTAPAAPSTPDLAAASDSGSSNTDNITNVTTPTFTGTAEAGATVTLFDGASQIGSATADGSGSYSITSSALSQGPHSITAKATDAAGNTSVASAALSMTIDIPAPAAPSIASVTDDVSPVTGTLSSGGSTNDTDLTVKVSLSGTNAVAGDSVQLYNGTGTGGQLGASYTLTASDISNGFADVQTGALSSGTTYTITARVTDQAGNQSTASGSFVITETGTAPNAPSIASVTDDVSPVTGTLSSGGSTNDTDLTVKVSLSGTNAVAGDSIQLYNGAGTGGQLGASYTLTASDISNGFADVQTGALSSGTTYTITARVTDQAGNQSTASGSFVIGEDTAAPSAPVIGTVTDDVSPVTGTVADNGVSNDTTLTITGAAEAGSTVTIYDTDGTTVLGSGVASGGSYSITTSALSQGSHTLTARATDAAGNQGVASSAFHVTIDTAAPSAPVIGTVTDDVAPVTGTVADNGVSNDTTLTITGAAEAGSTVTIYDTDGTTVLGSGVASGGSYSITTSALSQGSHTLTARATDAAGNQGVASSAFHVTLDTAAPSAPVIGTVTDDVSPVTGTVADNGVSNDTTLTITGAAEAGSTVTIYDTDGTTVLGSGVASGGSYSITTSALSQGSHTLTARATDAAGNQGVASSAFHVTIDTAAPNAAVAITTVSGSSSPTSTAITILGTNGILATGEKVQISADGVTWADVIRVGLTGWSFIDTTTRSANVTYFTRVLDSAGNIGATATQAILVAGNGATVTASGFSPTIAQFTGTGGTLQIGAAGSTATINAISVASGGSVTIGGSGNVTTTVGDAINLYATGAAQASPANLVVNPDGTITGAGTGIAVTQNAAGSITVTTTGPVTGLAGRGVFAQQTATGTGAILINGSGNVTGTGAAFSGIVAQNLNSSNNANVTVSQAGNITGGYDGIRAQTNGNGNIIVNTGNGAQISGLTLYGIEAQSRGTGNIQISTAAGTVITSGGAGIIAYNEATSLPKNAGVITSSISVNANGIINSGTALTGLGSRPAGILAGYKGSPTTNTVNPNVFGNVVIDNFATINAAGGDGIRGYNFGGGNVTITNNGATIVARDVYGINGSTNGVGNVSITTTAGSSITSGSHGILAINSATSVAAAAGSTVSVTTSGTINSGVHLSTGGAQPAGISAGYFGSNGASNPNINGAVSVDNAANISTGAGYGIIAFHVGYGNITIVDRTGTSVSGALYGILATSAVVGTATPSNMTINVEDNATVTASSLYGVAGISAGNPSGGNISISTGSGVVVRSGGTGVNANIPAGSTTAASQITITTQQGTISSGYNFFTSGGTPSGISAGYSTNGVLNTAVHGNVVLDNSATITAVSGPGINLYNNGLGNISATLQATSLVSSAQAGVNAFSAGGGNITVDNRGTIIAGGIGINVGNGASNPSSANGQISVINSGTVSAPGAPFMPVVTIGNGNSSQTAMVSNSFPHSIASSLFPRTTNNVAISFFAGNGSVTNSGSITGNVSFAGNGSFTNASGALWSLNGSNFFGNGTSVINNAGFINMSGVASLSAISAIALMNTSNIFVLENSSAQIFGNVTGVGTVNLLDRSALEFGLSVAATQTVNLTGKGLLTFDNPASAGSNLPINFMSSTNGNVGSVITLQGAGITAANVSGATLTVTGAQSYSFQVTGSGLSGNTFNVLSPNRIVLVPTTGAGSTIISNVNTPSVAPPAAPVNSYSVYILDNDHITGSGTGFLVSTGDTVATNTYAVVVNASSDISVTGAGAGVRVATSGASAAVVNAATVSAGNAGISIDTGLSGNGSADVVDYGNVSGGQTAITANTFNGNVNIVAGPGVTLTGTNSYGIFGRANGSGGVSITTSGGTISGGITGILALALQASPSGADVLVYNSSNITSGTNGAAANVANSGTGGIRAGILNNNTSTPNAVITGDVTIESRGSITAQYGAGLYAFNYGSGNTSVTLAPGWSITATAAGTTPISQGLTQYGIFAFNYGAGSTLVNAGWGTTITSGGTGINAGNQATAIASGSGSTVSVYSQGFISSGGSLNNSGSAPSAIQAGYNPGNAGLFNANVFGDVIVNLASDGNPLGNPNPTILAARGAGINAYNYGVGNVTVSVGSGVSIQTLAAATASAGNAPYGIATANHGPGSITVTTSGGSSINSASVGINSVNDSNAILAAANAVIAVTTAGTIHSGSLNTNGGSLPSGIAAGFLGGSSAAANLNVNGAVFINNAADITADAGFGIQAYHYGNGNITVNDAIGADVTAASHGIYAHAEGAGTGDIAVNVYANVNIVAGTASSTAYGILAFSTNAGSISIITTAGGTIDSHLGGAGINAVNQATSIAASVNSSVVVTNAAAIHSGSGLTGFGNRPAGILAGYLGGTTNPSPDNLANYNVNGEVVVNNFANIIADSGDGIRAYNFGVGNVTVNNFGGTITALGGASPPNGSGIGILAQTFGPSSVHVTTSASTSITSGSSGIAAVNKAISADPSNPAVVVPATSEISVRASGTIHSGTIPTATVAGDPAAGILAGYNPNNQSVPNNGVHGDVFVDSHATILAPAGTDGIRAVNYGDGDITIVVESDSAVMGGRYGVAALGYNGGNVSITNYGLITASTYAVNATTTLSGTAVIDNFGHLIGNATGYNVTFTNELSGGWSLNGLSVFSGTSTLVNSGLIDSNGVSAISGLSSITNTGTIEVQSGSLTLGTPMTGAGTVVIYGATMEFGGASDANVQFSSAAIGTLVLDDVSHFTGTVTGFSFGDTIYLADIAPANVSITNSGSLYVSYGTGSFSLIGNYEPASFSIVSDGGTGTNITWNQQTPAIITDNLTIVFNPDLTTTVLGVQVTDSDAAASLDLIASTGAAASGTSITPSLSSGSLVDINNVLASGVTYHPGSTPPATDKVMLTVMDSFGATDTVNFVFNQAGSGPNITLQGTSGKDIIFATSSQDVLTGGAGEDQFHFAPTSSGPTVQHTITDFESWI